MVCHARPVLQCITGRVNIGTVSSQLPRVFKNYFVASLAPNNAIV